jgi:flagellar protein FliO/FliZ
LLDRIDAEAMDEAALDAPTLNQSNSSAFLDTFKQQLAQIEEVRKKR